MLLDRLADQVMNVVFKVLGLLQHIRKLLQDFRDSGVEHHITAGDGVRGAEHAELKLIARKREGRGTVAIGSIASESRQNVNAELHIFLLRALILGIVLDCVQHSSQLVAEEDGDDGGRRFIRA